MSTLSTSTTRTTPRFFYGWLIALIAFCGSFITAGTSGYVFGQFIAPLSQAFNWSETLVTSASSVRSIAQILITPIVGRLTDRIGSRPVMMVGALIGGGAFFSLAFIYDPIVFYIVFAVVISVGYAMLGGVPSQAAVARWFRRKRGMAIALVSIGISAGGAIMVPLVQWLLSTRDWRFTFGAIGIGVMALMLPLVYLFMRDYPEQMGLRPDGDEPLVAQPTSGEVAPTPLTTHDDLVWTTSEALRSINFWKQALGYMFAFAMLQTTMVFQFPFITGRGFDGATAAAIVSGYAICAGLSKFGWGYLADRYDVRKVAVCGIELAAVGIIVLMFANDLPMMWAYAIVGGAGIGGLAALQGMVTAVSFGRRSYGTVAGLLNPMNSIASALLVPFAAYLKSLTGSYVIPFGVIVALVMISCLSLLWLPRGEK